MSVGSRIQNLRKQQKLTLKALGSLISLSPSFLCDVEKERVKPSLKALEAIALALNTSVAYLMGEDDSVQKLPQRITDTVKLLSADEQGLKILQDLSDFNHWQESDKEELIHYLKAKSLLRQTQNSNKN